MSIIDGTENSQAHALTLRRIKIVGDKDRNINVGDEDLLRKYANRIKRERAVEYSCAWGLSN